MSKHLHGYIKLSVATIALVSSSAWYITSLSVAKPVAAKTEMNIEKVITEKIVESVKPIHTGRYVLINLDQMTLELHDGATTLKTLTLVSKGKPGSYYETIGGIYASDYKEPLHFSSIGHVYMPYSMHIFGNFFIHGIPYYPDGTRVSSTYSGGCIRLEDPDAKLVYDFLSPGMPMIITRGGEYDFESTATTTAETESLDMTRLMVATISLEFLKQDNEIVDTDGIATTTRRKLIPRLLEGDTAVATLYAKAIGEHAFLTNMNAKAKSLGLTNTTFTDVQKPAQTTEEDLLRFMNHIDTYGSYLRTDFRL